MPADFWFNRAPAELVRLHQSVSFCIGWISNTLFASYGLNEVIKTEKPLESGHDEQKLVDDLRFFANALSESTDRLEEHFRLMEEKLGRVTAGPCTAFGTSETSWTAWVMSFAVDLSIDLLEALDYEDVQELSTLHERAKTDDINVEMTSILARVKQEVFRLWDRFYSDDSSPRSRRDGSVTPKDHNSRLSVTLDPPQAVLDGCAHAITLNGAILLDALLKAESDWVAGHTLEMRADRVKRRLPKSLRELIKASPGKGYRIPREALV